MASKPFGKDSMTIWVKLILLLLLICAGSSCSSAQSSTSNLEELAKERRWVELREVAGKSEHATFYRAMAAAVFNESEAESLFMSIIRTEPSTEEAYESDKKSGRYNRLAVIREAEWKAFPKKEAIVSQKKEDAPFMSLPDQQNGPRRASTFHHDGRSLPAPATINRKHVEFFFDNGADLSCISEAEAKRLGMTVSETSGSMGTMTNKTGFRMATAKDVTIGKMHFRDVSFAVFPDDKEPWSLVPLGQRGIIGLPLIVGIGTFRWRADGTLTIGEEPKPLVPKQSNLIFDVGDHLVLKASFQGQPIWTAFDSGATTTDIYAPFARQFSDYLKQNGKIGNNEIVGLGGAESYDTIDVPALPLEIAGQTLTLRPAHIMTKRNEHRDWIFANIGKDFYMQTSRFTLDFQAMRLTLQ
jgi:hypothetical protein